MKRFKLLIIIFSVALSVPLAFFVVRTYRGLEQEEVATLRFFAEAIFEEMEQSLAALVQREEGRAIDEYNYYISSPGRSQSVTDQDRSPLSNLPRDNFILGYFQNNPDGSFQTPMAESAKHMPADKRDLVDQLKNANIVFNRKRVAVTDKIMPRPPHVLAETEKKPADGFADKYLDMSRAQKPRAYLGQKEKRVEKITVGQALNIAKQEQAEPLKPPQPPEEESDSKSSLTMAKDRMAALPSMAETRMANESYRQKAEGYIQPPVATRDMEDESFQVEVAPLQSVFINDDQIFIFRRIMINNQIYRQGFILETKAFLDHLANAYFRPQPMARYTNLRLAVMDQGRETRMIEAGASANGPKFVLQRTFPSPFSFLNATLTCDQIPRSSGRQTLNIMMIVLAVIVLLGLFAIYQSARTIVDLSERRSQFVSSVTHELKTPLTNIRMYIEMLEQGIARDPEQEQEYFRILDSEGARLSRLINNILELSKLEKRQRQVDMQTGSFEEVIREVQTVMHEKLKQEGFTLKVEKDKIRPFPYDREIMIQVLINLIENSMKFGKNAAQRRITIRIDQDEKYVNILVSDTGPGIPPHALKKVFDDFYRVENSLTRTTRGTGIGLALVKKFVTLMGGTVAAANNDGPGCTITISLPS
ncbi:MAG: HAMP domain-containing histidine kinase [Desulfobacterales bacterium]|nr:MAG: HAMP domain-containing histidine kinase [Desulfobacterales bacterium]